ncbi:MAG: hypothetical protein EXQ60_06585 [Candidatus Nanopelagicales bacterium]|nr:hypothetical protein [Candidatus Nanopelagicales bacterium]
MEPDSTNELGKLIDSAGPIAGLFVLALGVALALLWLSLNRQMKRINPDLPMGRDDKEQAEDRELTKEAVERGADEQPPNS